MANWLSRATDAFRKPPPVAPEPFTVRCDCGGTVSGVRVASHQRPACSSCGRQVFVLPANVYPTVSRPKKVQADHQSAPPVTSKAPGTAPTTRPGRQGNTSTEQTATATPRDGILLEAPSRLVTPFRLIVATISLILALTAWGLWHRHSVELAKAEVAATSELGMKALQDGDFAIAASNLVRARNAVDLLRRTDPEANAIRRNCREAVAGNELSTTGLFDLLAEFATESRVGRSKFTTLHRGAWLLLDVTIANPDATAQPCEVDMPLLIEGMTFRVIVDSPQVRVAAQREAANGSARVIFAAPMSALRTSSGGKQEGILELNGKAAFLWTSIETYASLGYQEHRAEDLAATKDILARQLEQTEGSR